MIKPVRLLILESILDDDCQAHDDNRHHNDNEISDSGHNDSFNQSIHVLYAQTELKSTFNVVKQVCLIVSIFYYREVVTPNCILCY